MYVQKRCTRYSLIHIIIIIYYILHYLYNSAIIAMDTEGLLLVLLFIVRGISSTGQRNCSSVQVRKLTIVIIPTLSVYPSWPSVYMYVRKTQDNELMSDKFKYEILLVILSFYQHNS